MRKSPKESATLYRVGTKKEGLDTETYYVMKDKNNRKRWVKEGCFFVMYEINQTSVKNTWNYGRFPGDWQLIGGGITVPIQNTSNKVKYPREEQFMGNPKYADKMKTLLKKTFDKLKDKKIVNRYKIVSKKGLHNYMDKMKYQ